jgi:hypothetical protein
MDHRDDRRAEELESLGLKLATFALWLDAFEARLRRIGEDERRLDEANHAGKSRSNTALEKRQSIWRCGKLRLPQT